LRVRPRRATLRGAMDGGTTKTRAMRWTEPGWRGMVLGVAVSALLGAVTPVVRRSMNWPAGLRRRWAVLYVVLSALSTLAIREFAHPMRLDHDDAVAAARVRLGREPTDADLHRELGRRMLRHRLDREPTEEELDRALRPGDAG
jgi:hypothetical protein